MKVVLKYLFARNFNKNIIQNQFDISFNNTFNNYYSIDIGISKDFKHYIDRFYDDFHETNETDVVIRAPLYERISLEFSNDQRENINYIIGLSYFSDDFYDYGNTFFIENK